MRKINISYRNSFAKLLFALCLLVLVFTQCSPTKNHAETDDGVYEMSLQDVNGTVCKFTGNWKFYWNQHIQTNPSSSHLTDPISIPIGNWSRHSLSDGSPIPHMGSAIYALRITNVQVPKLALRLGTVTSAYKVWCNDELVSVVGNPDINIHKFQPDIRTNIVELIPRNNVIDLYIEVVNNIPVDAGILRPVYFGTPKDIQHLHEMSVITEIAVVTFVLAIVLYNLLLHLSGREDPAYLYFSLFCLFGLGRQIMTDSIPIKIWIPMFPAEAMLHLKVLFFCMSFGVGVRYIYLISKPKYSKKVALVTFYLSLLASVLYALGNYEFRTYLIDFLLIYYLIGIIYTLYILFKLSLKRYEYLFIFSGFLVMTLFFINDALVSVGLVANEYLQHFGLLSLAIAQAIYLTIHHQKVALKLKNTTTDIEKVSALTRLNIQQQTELLLQLKELKNVPENSMIQAIRKQVTLQNDSLREQQHFMTSIDKSNTEFFALLKKRFPDLTSGETELCGFIRAGLTTKQIAAVRKIDPTSVKRAKNRLRQKLKLEPQADLYEFLETF